MRKAMLISALLGTSILVGGCNRKPTSAALASKAESGAMDASNVLAVDTTPLSKEEVRTLNEAAAEATATNDTANLAARKPGQSLSFYVGHYPFESFGGTSFRNDPAVKRAVMAAVPDRRILDFVLTSAGPESRIKVKGARIIAWGCQAHDCNAHHWSIAIAPDGSNAEVCYFDSENPETGKARYYSHGHKAVERLGQCPDPGLTQTP